MRGMTEGMNKVAVWIVVSERDIYYGNQTYV